MKTTSPLIPNGPFRRARWPLSAAGLAVAAAAILVPGLASASGSSRPIIASGSQGSSGAMTNGLTAQVARPCTTAHLRATLGAGNGTAGSVYVPLELTNTGMTACVTGGYPGVSYVRGAAGTQVGAPAVRIATVPPRTVTLAAGQTATATLREVDAGNFASCGRTTTRGLRVYPPNQRTALFVAQPGQGCADPAVIDLYTTALRPPA